MWAGPQTAIHTHSKPPCDCVFHMPSRSPHITVCTTMIHSQPTCDCAGNAENFDLLCFSRSIFIYNLHHYQVQLRPTNSPLENGKRVEHRGQQDTFLGPRGPLVLPLSVRPSVRPSRAKNLDPMYTGIYAS